MFRFLFIHGRPTMEGPETKTNCHPSTNRSVPYDYFDFHVLLHPVMPPVSWSDMEGNHADMATVAFVQG